MLGLTSLWNAVTELTATIRALSATLRDTNSGLRQQLRLDAPVQGHEQQPPLLASSDASEADTAVLPVASSNGKQRRKVATVNGEGQQ